MSSMPRLPFFLKLFRSKPLSDSVDDSQAPKQTLTLPRLSKFKTSTKIQYQTLSAAFHTNAASSDYIDEDFSTDNIDFSQCLPAVDSVGTDLGLDFDHQHVWQASSPPSVVEDDGQAVSSTTTSLNDMGLMMSPTQYRPHDHGQRPTSQIEYNRIGIRSSIYITSETQDVAKVHLQPRPSFVNTSYGTTISSIIAVPESPLISHKPAKPNKTLPREEPTSSPTLTLPNVTLHPSSNTPSDVSETEIERNFADSSPPAPVLDVRADYIQDCLILDLLTKPTE